MGTVLVSVPLVWAGMVLAISFLEAPIKFRAPGITRELGLGIGRLVFRALNRVEWVMALLLLAALCVVPPHRLPWFVYAAVFVALSLQTFCLRPLLNARSERVLRGEDLPPSPLHVLYILIEAVKVIVLLALGVLAAR
jgi:hypothetical protein